MKHSFLTFSLLVIFSITLSSCSKDEDTTPTDNTTSNNDTTTRDSYVSATVNDKAYISQEGTIFNQIKKNSSSTTTTYELLGINANAETISIFVRDFQGTGTYSFTKKDGDDDVSAVYVALGESPITFVTDLDKAAVPATTSGSITITYADEKKWEGTFEFIAVNALDGSSRTVVKDGKFKLNF